MVSNGEPLNLEVIKARAADCAKYPFRVDARSMQLSKIDVPALLAEVERVRTEVERALGMISELSRELVNSGAEVESLRRQVAEADGAIVQLVRRVEAMDELFRRAQEWREMRRGSPTKPKPESAALILAVDALSQPVAEETPDG